MVANINPKPPDTHPDVSKAEQKLLWDLVCGSGQGLDVQQQDKLYALLLSFADVFALCDKQLGRTDKLQHSINMKGSHPIRQQPRRLPPFRREVHQLLDDMLSRDIILPSTSPWASPIVLVKKKDDTTQILHRLQKTEQCNL